MYCQGVSKVPILSDISPSFHSGVQYHTYTHTRTWKLFHIIVNSVFFGAGIWPSVSDAHMDIGISGLIPSPSSLLLLAPEAGPGRVVRGQGIGFLVSN